jgi:hypothetical protein
MNKPIKAVPHGFMDYLAGIFVLVAPSLFGFRGAPAIIFYVAGTLHLLMSLMTNYPLGLVKTIPFTVHSKIEISTAVFLIASPWLFGFSEFEIARNIYVVLGAGIAGLWSLTDYNSPAESAKIIQVYPENEDYRGRKAA